MMITDGSRRPLAAVEQSVRASYREVWERITAGWLARATGQQPASDPRVWQRRPDVEFVSGSGQRRVRRHIGPGSWIDKPVSATAAAPAAGVGAGEAAGWSFGPAWRAAAPAGYVLNVGGR